MEMLVAFCSLFWSFVTSRCFCMMVCGANCHFYGHCRILWYLVLWWYSWVAAHFEFVFGDFHTISCFFSKIWMFWMEYDILVWGEADFMVVSMISVWI